MSRIVYLDGEFVPEAEAKVSIFDRGFLMADAVYEVTCVLDGELVDFDGHAARLARSLRELSMPSPCDTARLLAIHRELVRRNRLVEGVVYLQVTRGDPGDRSFDWPDATRTPPTLVLFTQRANLLDPPAARKGIRVVTVADLRWRRRDIKTTQLLAPSMCKSRALAAGVEDAWCVEEGFVTEGTSSNAWIVADGAIVTRDLSHSILHGITRAAVLRLAREAGLAVAERAFTVAEAQAASEAFATSASSFVKPVVEIDGVRIGAGTPGPVATRLRAQHRQSAVCGGAELTKPASSRGHPWPPPAPRPLQEPRGHSTCPERLRCRRQAVAKSHISLPLTISRQLYVAEMRRAAAGASATAAPAPPSPARPSRL